MKSEDLIAKLQTEVSRLRKLKGEDVSFFFVMPPGGDMPSTQLFSGTEQGVDEFYAYLGNTIQKARKAAEQRDPYISVAGMRGRG